MKEIWKDVFEYEGFYKVSHLGNIISLDRYTVNNRLIKSKYLKTRIGKDGTAKINLSKDGIKKTHSFARIVYKAFNSDFDYYNNNLLISHKNLNKTDDKLENLYILEKSNVSDLFWNIEKRKVICLTTNKEFECINHASRYYKINSGNISACCQKKSSFAGIIILDDGTEYKLVWKYLDRND